VVTAYRWIPWLTKRHSWTTPNFGEPYVTQAANDVTVTLTSDRTGVKYATSGHWTGSDGASQTFEAHNVRDFNFSASPKYKFTTWDHNGATFGVYTLTLSAGTLGSLARTAFDAFSDKVAAYPYQSLNIAEIPVGGGMESPGMIWIPSNATRATRKRYLVTHEIAHQWFYGVVGNDQATDPFADEAVAEYLARTIIGFRNSRCRETNLDGSVYDYSATCYYEVIYVQGADYLRDYHDRVGNDAFWAGLRDYYEKFKFGLGGTFDLLESLDGEAGDSGGGHAGRFPSLFPHKN
jgi:aminopeptidase N